MKKFILPIIAVVLLGSCDGNNDGIDPNNENKGLIDLRPGIKALTRSPHLETDGLGTFSDGDIFSLTISAGDEYVSMTDYTMPSTSLYWEDLKLSEGTTDVSFAGCYPKHDKEMGHTFAFNVNQAEGEGKDLLLAPAVKVRVGNTAAIHLPFYHAMHRLVIKYKSTDYADEDLQAIQTTLSGTAECLVDLTTGSISEAESVTQESYAPQTGKEISMLVVPQEKSKVSLQIKIGNETKDYNLSKLPQTTSEGQDIRRLEGGKQLIIELNINKNGISVSGVTIQGWETQGNGVGRHHHRITKSKGQTCLITRRNTYLIEKGLHVNPFCWYHKTNNYENKTVYFILILVLSYIYTMNINSSMLCSTFGLFRISS